MSAVAIEYTHASKTIRPAPSITLGDSVLKWYDLAPADEPVPPWLQVLARGSLHAAGEAGLGLEDELGFVILLRPGPREGTHIPTFCVWELGVVWHEQQAWSDFLRSPRGPASRKAYLHDTYDGEV
jgi:hypothetical protein